MNIVAEANPNEHFGVRACTFAGQQKSADCSGPWYVAAPQTLRVANPLAPHVAVCANHLHAAISEIVAEPAGLEELSL